MKADKINDFRGQGLNVYVTFDLLKSQLHSGHWINCSFQDFEKAFQIGLASGSNSQKLAAMQENAKTPKIIVTNFESNLHMFEHREDKLDA